MIDLDDMIIKQTILVVDANPENSHILHEILCPYYNVKVAHNAMSAFKKAADAERPDLILLEIMMPDIDGYRIAKYLKENVETSEIPIIFISARDKVEDEKKGFDVGAVDYIA
ncbi:MAG: response regulator, partial [Psychromonas sp.]|nr:response regulator [Psychromonas sp.]